MRSPAANGQATNLSAVKAGRPVYPRASWTPPRYSSPTTPGGTGRSPPSSTYADTLASGRPIGTVLPSSARWHCQEVTSTAASVGP